jgi:hypothetical protein
VIERSIALVAMATLMAAVTAPMASANLPPVDDKKEVVDKKGGNATDKATAPPAGKPAGASADSRPPVHYTNEVIDFWGLFMSGGSPFHAAFETSDIGRETFVVPELQGSAPSDAPAESVLDQIDESLAPPVLVGLPGSEASSATGSGNTAGATTTPAPAPSAGETTTPPSESILDFIDTAPAPRPAISTTQEASKPAVDQASKPAVVKSPPP